HHGGGDRGLATRRPGDLRHLGAYLLEELEGADLRHLGCLCQYERAGASPALERDRPADPFWETYRGGNPKNGPPASECFLLRSGPPVKTPHPRPDLSDDLAMVVIYASAQADSMSRREPPSRRLG